MNIQDKKGRCTIKKTCSANSDSDNTMFFYYQCKPKNQKLF